ncbi:MAG: PAS domain-containing protein [Betaproteobacteria bacterium]|nr:PAS domain-containing protein [Betaproteobacteria bacterium]
MRDISERKQAHEELRLSEQRLTLALKAADRGLYDLNVQTGEAIVSPEYASMLGYDPVNFHETKTAWFERLHPDDRDRVIRTYLDYIAGKIPRFRVEFRQRTHSGGWKWILSKGTLDGRDATGQPLRLLGTHTDITARKQAEETIRKSTGLLQSVVDHVPARIFWKDLDSRYLGCNCRLCEGCRTLEIRRFDWRDRF